MMANHRISQERLKELAGGIALQLDILFPEGYSKGDAIQRKTLQTCFQRLATGQEEGNVIEYPSESVIAAISHDWKQIQKKGRQISGQAGVTKSFSLLDQLNAEGGFDLPTLNVGHLQEESILEQAKVLNKIEYLEDILPDFGEIRAILFAGLKHWQVSDTGCSQNLSLSRDFLYLHRKWFDLGRASNEYLGVQYELCLNLSRCLQDLVIESTDESNTEWIFDVLRTWYDMFLDLMNRGHYIEEFAPEMESTLLKCLQSIQRPSCKVSPAQMLACIDPEARLFWSWVYFVSQHSLAIFLDEYRLLSVLWDQCQKITASQDTATVPAMSWYCLSILASILTKCRTCHFPWDSLSTQNSETMKLELFRVLCNSFWLAVNRESGGWKQNMCVNAMEIVLHGMNREDLELSRSMLHAEKPEGTNGSKSALKRIEVAMERGLSER